MEFALARVLVVVEPDAHPDEPTIRGRGDRDPLRRREATPPPRVGVLGYLVLADVLPLRRHGPVLGVRFGERWLRRRGPYCIGTDAGRREPTATREGDQEDGREEGDTGGEIGSAGEGWHSVVISTHR